MFVKKLIDKYGVLFGKYREREQVGGNSETANAQTDIRLMKDEDVDLHNTAVVANSMQYKPISNWFERKGIRVEVNHNALDTQGFYDEVESNRVITSLSCRK